MFLKGIKHIYKIYMCMKICKEAANVPRNKNTSTA